MNTQCVTLLYIFNSIPKIRNTHMRLKHIQRQRLWLHLSSSHTWLYHMSGVNALRSHFGSNEIQRHSTGNLQSVMNDEITHRLLITKHHDTVTIFSCYILTMLGRKGVISSVQTQDGYCCIGEFFGWAGIAVIVHTRFITKQQRGEAFVKLTDSLCLDETDEMK